MGVDSVEYNVYLIEGESSYKIEDGEIVFISCNQVLSDFHSTVHRILQSLYEDGYDIKGVKKDKTRVRARLEYQGKKFLFEAILGTLPEECEV